MFASYVANNKNVCLAIIENSLIEIFYTDDQPINSARRAPMNNWLNIGRKWYDRFSKSKFVRLSVAVEFVFRLFFNGHGIVEAF